MKRGIRKLIRQEGLRQKEKKASSSERPNFLWDKRTNSANGSRHQREMPVAIIPVIKNAFNGKRDLLLKAKAMDRRNRRRRS